MNTVMANFDTTARQMTKMSQRKKTTITYHYCGPNSVSTCTIPG